MGEGVPQVELSAILCMVIVCVVEMLLDSELVRVS